MIDDHQINDASDQPVRGSQPDSAPEKVESEHTGTSAGKILANSDAEPLRERIKTENSLFNTRTQLFLVMNGLLLNALGASGESEPLKVLLCLIGIVLTVTWLICISKTNSVIAVLTEKLDAQSDCEVEELVQKTLGENDWKRPNNILRRLPFLFILCWAIALVVHLIFAIDDLATEGCPPIDVLKKWFPSMGPTS